jgi:hypothetical protein
MIILLHLTRTRNVHCSMNTQFQNICIAVLCMFFVLFNCYASLLFIAVIYLQMEASDFQNVLFLEHWMKDKSLKSKPFESLFGRHRSFYRADNSADIILHKNKKKILFFIKYGPTHVTSYYQ